MLLLGIYAEFLDKNWDFNQITQERKRLLNRISSLRNNRDILVFASDLTKNDPAISIDYSDLLPLNDQLSNLSGKGLDIILETPGGVAEVVEDAIRTIRLKYESVGIIIPGWSKSAGTIFAMAGDEILMSPSSALGPVDAQIITNRKRYSADAFLEGLDKIKEDIAKSGKLNPVYIPILQNISPGEIQHCENAQNLSKDLVTKWLKNYKFKFWINHSNGTPVSEEERHRRAEEIAKEICSQSKWLTHGRSISISDFQDIGLKITDYSQNKELNDAITRYHTLLRITFENTNLYKLFETPSSQIYRFLVGNVSPPPNPGQQITNADINFECPKCHNKFLIQANLQKNVPLKNGFRPYPIDDNTFKCPNCNTLSNISNIRLQIEAQSGKKVV